MIALIMAGGSGTRFWPLSTKKSPKQFLNILGKKTMIQQTVARISNEIKPEDIYVVTNIEQKEMVKQNLPQLPSENIISEPYGRNTAACIGFASTLLSDKYSDDETMLVLPADHYIGREHQFISIIKFASKIADENQKLITFGIQPNYPATGYGYIEFGERIHKQDYHVYEVKKFKEKPDKKTAEKFLEAGNFAWNSGMFMWRIDNILNALEKHMPNLYEGLQRIKDADEKMTKEIYNNFESIPVDIGIMEKAQNAAVIPIDIDWNDIGSWKALDSMMNKDKNGNYFNARVINIDTKNSYVLSTKKDKVLGLIGIDNCVIVETDDALLVCDKDKAQKVKQIVKSLKE